MKCVSFLIGGGIRISFNLDGYNDVQPVYYDQSDDELSEFVDDDYPADGVTEEDYQNGLSLVLKWNMYKRDNEGCIEIDWESVRLGLRGETHAEYVRRKYGKLN